ncbi:MAG: hypothetical protein AAF567_10510 [Actinomycetota bacterium]
MTPTLNGRIQSRIALILLVGVPVTLILGLILPRPTDATTLGDMYEVFFTALAIVLVVGIVWEFIYHALQQLRWEKDWPTLFGLITGIPEGIVAYILLDQGVFRDLGDIPLSTFLQMFIIVWIVIWLVANGPFQIFFIRWRYRGGRFV